MPNNQFSNFTTYQILGLILPIVVAIISAILTYIGGSSSRYKTNLEKFFSDVLCPIYDLLKDKTYEDFDENTLQKINFIYEENYYFIPKEMHRIHFELSCLFSKNKLDKREYCKYERYINKTLFHTRKKLKYPENYAWASIKALPKKNKCWLWLPPGITMFIYAYFLWNENVVWTIIFLVITICCPFVYNYIDKKLFNKKKEKWLNEKNNHETTLPEEENEKQLLK